MELMVTKLGFVVILLNTLLSFLQNVIAYRFQILVWNIDFGFEIHLLSPVFLLSASTF